ncbi:MAG TPA: DEAD/DEAH box helicase [Chthonomonadaceae bacterium]|nr:DEAD/DEAH box helicase [Chthonomonadaceae bacterium]
MIASLAQFFGTFLCPQPGPAPGKLAVVPELISTGRAVGRPLPGRWAEEIEYRLAELGYGLRAGVPMRAIPRSLPVPWRAHLQGDTLFIGSSAVREGRFTERFLVYDLPYALIDLPACLRLCEGDKLAAELAADYLALQRLADPVTLGGWLDQYARKSRTALDPLEADRLAQALQEMLPEQVLVRIATYQGREAVCRKRAPLERAAEIAAAALADSEGTDPRPAFRISPDSLPRAGIPEKGVQWLADRYGWTRCERGWGACFLPLQTLAISRGICDPQRLLCASGVVSAPTSAGKTLLAELRVLARCLGEEERPRQTVYLVPTREIGREKAETLRAAYGVGPGGLRICYSDGDHRGQDRQIGEGRFDVAVLVNEKLKLFQQNPRFFAGVGEVVCDELDMIAEGERGVFLEMALTGALHAYAHLSVLGLLRPCAGAGRALAPARAGPGDLLPGDDAPPGRHRGRHLDPADETGSLARRQHGRRARGDNGTGPARRREANAAGALGLLPAADAGGAASGPAQQPGPRRADEAQHHRIRRSPGRSLRGRCGSPRHSGRQQGHRPFGGADTEPGAERAPGGPAAHPATGHRPP